jgi:hypothetical protein
LYDDEDDVALAAALADLSTSTELLAHMAQPRADLAAVVIQTPPPVALASSEVDVEPGPLVARPEAKSAQSVGYERVANEMDPNEWRRETLLGELDDMLARPL